MNAEGSKLISSVFDSFMGSGANMFIATRLAPTEEEHCFVYYNFMRPAVGSTIVDMGSGIGECGAIMQQIDPSLKVINVVNDPHLINKMEALGRFCINESFEHTMLPNNVADVVMFNESIGYSSLGSAFKEASRIIKDDGVMVIKDFTVTEPSNHSIYLENWDYAIRRPNEFIREAANYGFSLNMLVHPPIYIKHWYDIMQNDTVARESALMHNPDNLPLCTSLYRFVKGGLNGRAIDCA